MAKKVQKKPRRRPTARQRRLLEQLPAVATGQKTQQQAMLDAGYAPSTALQQTEIIGSLRNNAILQEALRKQGLDENLIATQMKEGIERLPPGRPKLAYVQSLTTMLNAFGGDKGVTPEGQPVASGIIYLPAKKPEGAGYTPPADAK